MTAEEAAEVWLSGVEAPSRTNNRKAYVSPTVNVDAGIAQCSRAPALAPLPPFTAHWVEAPYAPPLTATNHFQENDAVPVVGMTPVIVNVWSTSRAAALGEGAPGAESVELTANVEDAGEVRDSGVEALSVTSSWNANVWPTGRMPDPMEHVSSAPALAPVPPFTAHCVAGAYAPPSIEAIQVQS